MTWTGKIFAAGERSKLLEELNAVGPEIGKVHVTYSADREQEDENFFALWYDDAPVAEKHKYELDHLGWDDKYRKTVEFVSWFLKIGYAVPVGWNLEDSPQRLWLLRQADQQPVPTSLIGDWKHHAITGHKALQAFLNKTDVGIDGLRAATTPNGETFYVWLKDAKQGTSDWDVGSNSQGGREKIVENMTKRLNAAGDNTIPLGWEHDPKGPRFRLWYAQKIS